VGREAALSEIALSEIALSEIALSLAQLPKPDLKETKKKRVSVQNKKGQVRLPRAAGACVTGTGKKSNEVQIYSVLAQLRHKS
jgi:hypothetical protein